MATYTKLPDGSWGVRSLTEIKPGQVVTVTKANGEVKKETIQTVTRGTGAWVGTIQQTRPARPANWRCRNPRDCGDPTCDGSCGY